MASSSFKLLATFFMLLAFTASARPTFLDVEPVYPSSAAAIDTDAALVATTTPFDVDGGVAIPCRARDISISQGETSGVGLPTWTVEIQNLCTNTRCATSEVVVHCGAFHSATFVNPHKFRRLDAAAGTCIVNDGLPVRTADAVTFQYCEIYKQELTLVSANVTCW